MSDAAERVKGIRHLPLFPLPLVLLPNEVLPLHIFEPRYRQLLQDVQNDRGFFGVSYFEPNIEGAEKPPIESIGCVAEIRDIQGLPDGRSNIVTVGVTRYRLLDYIDSGDPYLVGDVAFFDDEDEDTSELEPLADVVHDLFERVAKAAFKLSGSRGQFPEIPKSDPESLSFLITAAFNLDNDLKYKMLEISRTSTRLEKLREILEQAVTKMEESAEIHKVAQSNGHSDKKIDL